ncbi:MAG: tetratricopeptide repeat protein, partial [Gammaproteobacteria bacterium]
MNLFARILSHAFGILIVALLGLGYIYRGELFPELDLQEYLSLKSAGDEAPRDRREEGAATPESAKAAGAAQEATTAAPAEAVISEKQPATEPAAVAGETKQPAGSTTAGTASGTGAEITEAAPAGPAVEGGISQAPAVAATDDHAPEPAAGIAPLPESAPQEEVTEAEVIEAAPSAGVEPVPEAAPSAVVEPVPEAATVVTEETTVTPETGAAPSAAAEPAMEVAAPEPREAAEEPGTGAAPAAEAETVPEAGVPASETAPTPTDETIGTEAEIAAMRPYQLLAKAREAFWLRDYEVAEKHYRALTQREPDNPDGYGELGNMYFSQGRWDEAAATYYEAGIRLIDEGLFTRAGQMVEIIRGLNGEQAGDLERQIEA